MQKNTIYCCFDSTKLDNAYTAVVVDFSRKDLVYKGIFKILTIITCDDVILDEFCPKMDSLQKQS